MQYTILCCFFFLQIYIIFSVLQTVTICTIMFYMAAVLVFFYTEVSNLK